LSRLRLALARDAGRRHFIGWSLEAKLAAWELVHARGASTARPPHDSIEKSARQHGFGRILDLLARDAHAHA
jgi:hypothetical protein